jgi:hypothetical protein
MKPKPNARAALLICAAILCCAGPTAATAAKDDTQNVLAPPDPPATGGPKPDWMQYQSPYAGTENDVSAANHTSEEILSWGSRAVADALTFQPQDFTGQIKGMQKYFIQSGWGDFAGYLKESQLLGVAQSGKYTINTIANGVPMIVDSGATGGVWQWTVTVPVMISVSAADAQGVLQPVSNRKARVRMIISRVPPGGGGDDGVAITGWKAEG